MQAPDVEATNAALTISYGIEITRALVQDELWPSGRFPLARRCSMVPGSSAFPDALQNVQLSGELQAGRTSL